MSRRQPLRGSAVEGKILSTWNYLFVALTESNKNLLKVVLRSIFGYAVESIIYLVIFE